uniref:Uncharacterized protein n=1 Tax=Megaselia scalaris TaxID=36166 RepID=T1GEE6_MEGSC
MGVEKLQLNKSQSVDTQRSPDIEERRTLEATFSTEIVTHQTNGHLTDPNSKEEETNFSKSQSEVRLCIYITAIIAIS